MRERRRGGGPHESEDTEHDEQAEEEETGPLKDELDRALETYVQEEAPQLGKGDAELTLADANQRADTVDERYAEDRYILGEIIGGFLCRKGHRALGFRRAGDCLKARFRLGRSWAYESVRFSKAATREEIKGMKWEVARAGLRLLTLLGLKTFAELSKKPLPIIAPDGEPVYFPATPEQLAKALEVLEKARKAPEPEDPEKAAHVERIAVNKGQQVLERHLEKTPALAELGPRVYLHRGKAQFDAQPVPLRGDLFDAYVRLVTEIRKIIGR